MRRFLPILTLVLAGSATAAEPAAPPPPPFALRGYYITFMRMPTFGLTAWKEAVDCIHPDGGNVVVLWIAGGFRSVKYPDTWAYNQDHENVKHDFLRDLIDYAHTKQIKVLLGFTPFGYDGVNRMSLTHPDWTATGPDGKPTRRFGIHCWGYNLCPAGTETQRFMLEYVREMYFDFYPNADGLLIESSDYAACHCPACGVKYYDNEFRFVRSISEEVWRKKPGATVVVYPHYFTGARVPGLNLPAAKQAFDPRWTVFFTPHSAHVDAELVKQAANAIWSDDSPALHNPAAIRDNARRAKAAGCSGYVPSLEAFSYVATEPEEGQQYLVGRRQVPFGFGWLKDGQMPYNELPIRVNRVAYREYTRNPALTDAAFATALGLELFGKASTSTAVADALYLQQVFINEHSWCQAAPLADPERVRAMQAAGKLSPAKRKAYRTSLDRVRQIEQTYRDKGVPFAEMHRVAKWLADQWAGDNATLLAP
jgi:hypothetical protein